MTMNEGARAVTELHVCGDLEAVSAVDAGLSVALPPGDVAGVLVPAVGGLDAVPQALRGDGGSGTRLEMGLGRVLARLKTSGS